jgi:hypothetical protein
VSTLERAIAIAAEAHAGQVDKAGAPYVLHPLRMMLRVSSPDERIVAVLHDVCEDCQGWTFDRFRAEGFSEHIIQALQSVTKRDGEGYEAFVRRAASNPIGRRVKLADLHEQRSCPHRHAVRAGFPTHGEIPTRDRPDQSAFGLTLRAFFRRRRRAGTLVFMRSPTRCRCGQNQRR